MSIALQNEKTPGAHLAALDVPRGEVVEDHVAADVVLRLLGREPLSRLAQHDRELELVVELLGQVLGVDHRLVGADDRVDVLEEVDPRRDVVRPADVLGLGLVLAEVARRVEELLRDDRCAQARVGERDALARDVRAAALEVPPHGRDVEDGDLLAVEHPDPSLSPSPNVTSFIRAPSVEYEFRDDSARALSHATPQTVIATPRIDLRRLDEPVDLEVLAQLDVHQPGRGAVVDRRHVVAC